MKKLKSKLILILTAVIVAAIFTYNIISLAASSGGYTLGPENLEDTGMYCLEHEARLLKNGPTYEQEIEYKVPDKNDPTKTTTETRTNYIDLTYVNYYSAKKGEFDSGVGEKAEDRTKKTIAAILLDPAGSHGKPDSPSSEQYSVWAGMSEIVYALGASKSNTRGTDAKNDPGYVKAKEQAENNEAKITRLSDGTISSDNYKVGPFKVNFNDTGNGKITKITVVDSNNKEIDGKYISFMQSGELVSANKIEKNVNFYVINKSGQEVKKVTVETQKTARYYRVKYTLYTSSGVKLRDINKNEYDKYQSLRTYQKAQTLVKVERSGYDETTTASTTFTVKAKKGDLELTKKGLYGVDGKLQNPETLENVTFKIYCNIKDVSGKWVKQDSKGRITYVDKYEDATKLWIKQDSKGKITYVDKYEDATEFTTDKDGKLEVKNLYSGDNYSYSAVEVKNGNPYYNDVIEINDSKTNQSKDKDQKKGIVDINGIKYNEIAGITIYYNKENSTTVNDNRTSGDLTIVKQDSIYNDLKLKGAEFKVKLVKASNLENVENMWLTIPKECDVKGSTYDYNKISHDKYLTSDESKASVFTTDENGNINIKKIVNGTYQIYETKTPVGYDITKQDGYDPENKWVDCGTVDVKTEDNLKTFTFKNKKIIASLKGMVWVDGEVTKDGRDAYDSIYGEGSDELLKEEIPVTLYQRQRDENKNLIPLVIDEDGKITSGAVAIATTTLKDGYYEFTTKNTGEDKNIYYWDLADCFVEFIYDNKHQYNEVDKTYDTAYITADYLQKAKVKDEKTGEEKLVLDMTRNSKAQEYNATPSTLNDTKLGGVQEEIKGRAITTPNAIPQTIKADSYKEILEKEGTDNGEILTTYYNNDTYCVENINLGLQNKYQPSFGVDEEIAYIKVVMNGYEYKYVYGGTAREIKTVPTVKEQITSSRYSSVAIYPSDIAYNVANSTDELKAYVVYRIDVANTTQEMGGNLYDNVYEEQKMYLDSLTNTYDNNRYELSADKHSIDEDIAKGDFDLWSTDGDKTVKYDLSSDNSRYKNGIINKAGENIISSYVQFRIKDETLRKILNGEITKDDVKDAASIANVSAYHEYIRTDNIWHDDYKWINDVRAYEGHNEPQPAKTKNDSNNQTYFLHRSVNQTGSSPALFLKLKLPEKERTVSGRVFEDKRTKQSENDNTNLGSGTFEPNEPEKENVVDGVTVELLSTEKDGNGQYTLATLYKYDQNAESKYFNPPSKIKTNKDGTYAFVGVVPGEYYLRFTYGDGTQKLCDINGKEIPDSEIYSNQYRSTIITNDNIKNAIENKNIKDTEYTWYKGLEDDLYSVAVDDYINQRSHDDEPIGEEPPGKVSKEINAYSPKTSITIENDEDEKPNEQQVPNRDENNNDSEEKNGGDAQNYEVFNKFNFGIIDEINTMLTLSKKMTNLSLTASQGTSFVNSNPIEQKQFVSDLDKETEGGSKYAKIEIDANNMYGSTLKTTYKIEVTNVSLKDYVEDASDEHYGWYWKYGDNQYAKPKKVTIREITDKLDSKYMFDSEDVEKLEVEQKEDVNDGEQYKYRNLVITLDESDDKWKIASDKTDETSSLSFEYTVRSTLSTNDEDSQFLNDAKITSIRLPKLTSLQTEFEYPKDHTTLTITPPTGENRSNEYWIIGVIAIMVLAGGIIIIKKKILK